MRKAFVLLVSTLMLIGGATFASAGSNTVKAVCHPNCYDGVNLYGDRFDNKLVGTDEHDHIFAQAGNDRIWLGFDTDWVWAGAGNDIIRAYAPQEHAASQQDYVNCGPGNDVVKTGAGDADVLHSCETVLLGP